MTNVIKLSGLFLLISMSFGVRKSVAQQITTLDSSRVTKIWSQSAHSAFTDLIRFKGNFYCAFREGESHVSGTNSGKIRIIRSGDGKKWESVSLLQITALDLRDAKLSITPQDKMMVTMAGAAFEDGVVRELYPFVAFSDESGFRFSAPEKAVLDPAIAPTQDWIWRVTWHKDVGYGIDYQLKENGKNRSILPKDAWLAYVLKTTDGRHFDKVAQLDIEDLPNEATIRFDDNDRMYVLVRREAKDQMGVLAESTAPYQNWQYHKLDFRLGGPNFLFLNDSRLVIGSRRFMGDEIFTGLMVTDLQGQVLKTIKLPSGGDNSYPGMLIYDKKLWVSYYSSHEGKTSIYITQVPLDQLLK